MAKEKNQVLWIVGLVVLAFALYQYSSLGAIGLNSPSVQYYDSPIVVDLRTNLVNPEVKVYFNDVAINPSVSKLNCTLNETCIKITSNLNTEGILTATIKSGSDQEVYTTQIKQPYLIVENDILANLSTGRLENITLKTFNQDNEAIDVDSISLTSFAPDKSIESIKLTKSGVGVYQGEYNYKDKGEYNMKISASKEDYKDSEYVVFTSVLKGSGISLWVWVALGTLVLIIVGGFLVKRR